jgi:hypothetical protein
LAVAAASRHEDTPDDELLMSGMDRWQARTEVQAALRALLDGWRHP